MPPAACPACGQPVEHFEGEVAWYCVNAACPAQLVRNVEHFVSKGAMDINGLGIKIVEKLIETGAVRDVADIYTLRRDDILEAVTKKDRKTEKEPPGKIADNLLAAIAGLPAASRCSRLLTALGVRGVGEVSAARPEPGLPLPGSAGRWPPRTNCSMVEGIGPNIAEAIVDWFGRERNQKVLEKLKAAGVWPVESAIHRQRSTVLRPALRDDLRRHRHPAHPQPRGRQGIHRAARRQGDRFGQQEHQLPRAGRSAGIEIRKGQGVGGEGDWGRGFKEID